LPHRFTHSNETNLSVLVSYQQNIYFVSFCWWTIKSKPFRFVFYSRYAQSGWLCLTFEFWPN
jgi:hypothetical protein